METALVEQLRRNTPSIVERWLDGMDARVRQTCAAAQLSSGLLPLILDSLQFEGFWEAGHLAARVGQAAWEEGVSLGLLLEAIFRLRSLIACSLSENADVGTKSPDSEGVHRLVDRFAAECAQAHVQAAAERSAARPGGELALLQAATRAMEQGLMVVDGEGVVRMHNPALARIFGCKGSLPGLKIADALGEGAASAVEELIAKARRGGGRAEGALCAGGATLAAHVREMAEFPEGGFLVVLSPQDAAASCGASARRRASRAGAPSFGEAMKRLRLGRGISMRGLAEQVGLARGYVSNVEGGKVVPSFKAIARICDVLDPGGENDLLNLGVAYRLPEEIRHRLAL
jgi:PAS domain-containing protein/DNA-binding XRE family transcriptional regulator